MRGSGSSRKRSVMAGNTLRLFTGPINLDRDQARRSGY